MDLHVYAIVDARVATVILCLNIANKVIIVFFNFQLIRSILFSTKITKIQNSYKKRLYIVIVTIYFNLYIF